MQLCIVHLVRAALRYVNTQDSKPVIADLKKIYQAATVVESRASNSTNLLKCGTKEISDHRKDVACQVDRHHYAVRISGA